MFVSPDSGFWTALLFYTCFVLLSVSRCMQLLKLVLCEIGNFVVGYVFCLCRFGCAYCTVCKNMLRSEKDAASIVKHNENEKSATKTTKKTQ